MKKYTSIGLAMIALTLTVQYTFSVTGETVNIDVLPAFVGLLLLFFGAEKLPYRNPFLKEVSSISVFFAIIAFFTAAAQVYPFYINLLFPVKGTLDDGIAKFFASLIIGISDIYNQYFYIFLGVYTLYLAVVIYAMSTEMKKRIAGARVEDKFSYKDAYGDIHYSQKAYRIYNIVCKAFSVIYLAIGILYIVNNFFGISFEWLGFHIGLETMIIPVSIIYSLTAFTAVSMISGKRREDILLERKQAQEA